MATHLRDHTSAADGADISDEIAGGLEADEATAALAATWNGLAARGDAVALARRTARRTSGRARAREKVIDARWDRHDSAFGRAVLDASGGKRTEEPYATFFGKAPPSAVNAYGIEREVEMGRSYVALLAGDIGAALRAAWSAGWTTVNDALAAASRAKKDAVLAEAPHDAAETLYIDDINKELDRLEGDLLKIFPGDRATVDAFLAPTRGRARKQKPAPSDGPHPAAE